VDSSPRRVKFQEDSSLPSPDFYAVKHEDYTAPVLPDGFPLERGHLAASADRSRNTKDNVSTYLTSNIIPQHTQNNNPLWSGIEDFGREVAKLNKELYIIAGGYGSKPGREFIDVDGNSSRTINIPEALWRVVVILDHPGTGISNINTNNTKAFAIYTPNTEPLQPGTDGRKYKKWYEGYVPGVGGAEILTIRQLENRLNNDARNLATGIHYDFLSNISKVIQDAIEQRPFNPGNDPIDAILNAPLLAQDDTSPTTAETAIWHPGITKNGLIENNFFQIGFSEISTTQISSTQVSTTQIGFSEATISQISTTQISTTQIAFIKPSLIYVCPAQVSTTQVSSISKELIHTSTAEVDTSQIDTTPTQIHIIQPNPAEISFSSGITLQQFFAIHNFGLQNKTVPSWTEFLQSPTPFNLKVEITDLPTGQLAEGTITGYDTNGRPNSGTLTLDINGNNQGWFIDTTPGDTSEFDKQLTETAYQATNSTATGKYDLLTVILHELGHLQGIIQGNSAFDANVKNNTFIGNGFTATLTADGSHLDNTLYPYDLLNTSLKPGIRKLPSQLDLAVINQLYSNVTSQNPTQQSPNAALTAGALVAIENGEFTNTTGWNLQGGTTISNGAATLTETSQKLAQLTQDLIIPAGAKRLQFTIKDNHLVLGDSSKTANDAFEVALLGTNFKPLAGTSQGLNNTDSLLNIQANGTTYKSNKVTITPLTATSEVVSIDISDITPETKATLYFNLLGFGARTSTVTIDDIKIFSADQPIANNDNIVTNQSTPVTIDPTTNDSNVVGIQIIDRPTHGTLSQNSNGQIVYKPDTTYLGTDRFTYIGFNSEGSISNQGTVDITVNNVPPSIENITIPTSIKEGQPIQLSATAKDNGTIENLTYSWNLGDGTIVKGQQISHTFADNGIYQAILTVTDKDGGATEKAIELKVDNAAPNIVAINRPTQINEGQPTQFQATATDSGINDTLTYSWNFGDGSTPVNGQNVNHTFVDNGNYNVALTVTDNDGAATTKTEIVKVDNVLPSIVSINKPTQINEGQSVEFSAIATDAGSIDTLTYNWNFGDGSAPATGQTINHTFIDNGIYNAVLTVTDKDGGVTTQTTAVKVDNVAPVVVSITKPAQINEGQAIELSTIATDAGADDTLTYNWDLGDGTAPSIGQKVSHTYIDNGIYNVVLNVTDKDGGTTKEIIKIKVDNVAPTIINISQPPKINEGQAAQFSATATDPGLNDTLTYNWNFGDGTAPVIGQTINHTFADNGIYNTVLTVTDKDGAVTTKTTAVKVDNVAPVIVSITKPAQINEGQAVEFKAIATDVGVNDTLTYNWNFGDGTAVATGQTINHTFADNGTYNAVLTVADKDGGVSQQSIEIKVDNVAPVVVSIVKPAQINEGQAVEFKATATDAGANDTLTYAWNFGDTTNPVTGQNVTHTFVDNGNYNVLLTVTDKDGEVTTQTTAVKVDNVAPVIVSIVKPSQINEGQVVEFKATATDAGVKDTLTYSWNFGDTTNPVTGQNVTHTFADNGNYNVLLTVTDKDGGVTTQTTAVKVDNVAPVIVSITKPAQINEGQAVEFKATATDAGANDTLTYSWNFGDSTNAVIGQNATHTYIDNGNYNVVLTITDKDGVIATETTTVKVDNVLPSIVKINKPAQINEGQAAEFSAKATDAGLIDTLTYSWSFGDGTAAVTGQTVNHTFTDDGIYNAVLTVTDKDGGATQQAIEIKVNNVAPTIASIIKPAQINEGQAVEFKATATDAGVNDTLNYSWNFGDNTNAVIGQNATHTFADNGNYNVALTVTDKDGAVTTQTTAVKVDNVLPSIVSITKPNKIDENQTVEFSAKAQAGGTTDVLTYSWNFGDGSEAVIGEEVSHTFADNGIYQAVLTVIDKDGGVTKEAIDIKVDNVAPVIISITKPNQINEGQQIEFKAIAKAGGANDTLTYVWNFGDNSSPVNGQNATHTFADNGNYNVVLIVTDKEGVTTTQTTAVKVDNVSPLIVKINKPSKIDEGQSVQFSAIATDAGSIDTLTYSWNFGDGTAPLTGQQVSHTFIDNGIYNAILTVTDKDGGVTQQAIKIKVDNVAPVVVSVIKPAQISEGQAVEFKATVTDAGVNDTLTYTWNFGDNTNPISGQTVSHTFIDNGNYNVALTVTDKDGATTTKTEAVKVDNVLPSIVSINKPAKINEGQQIEFKAIAKAGGVNDNLTYVWNFGDSSSPVSGQNATHIFADNGNYNIVLTVTDKDGAIATETTAVKVDNVSPSIVKINKPNKIDEGQSIEFSAEANDPGALDNLTYSWKFGESTEQISGQKVNYIFTDNGKQKAILIVKDKDGGVIEESINLNIENVLPSIIAINKPAKIDKGQNVELSAEATDPGRGNLTYTWNLGDGSEPIVGQKVNHTFTKDGSYNAVLTVTDQDGGATKESIKIKVDNLTIAEPSKPTTTKPGVFTVGESGQISIDYLFDGGDYQAQMSIFSLACIIHEE
jgi:large repetitive protein